MTNKRVEENTTIETWKLDLDRLLWSYHENGRPDGKTGVIGNPWTIEEFIVNLLSQEYERGRAEERERIMGLAKNTTFGHNDRKLGTIIAMDYFMFKRDVENESFPQNNIEERKV